MALAKAVGLGIVAGAGMPLAARHLTGGAGALVARSTHHIEIGGAMFHWNWPLFLIVTIAAWGLLKAAA